MKLKKIGTIGAAVALAGGAMIGLAAASAQAATPIPDHVFSPYYEMWLGDNIATVSNQAGADHITLAFAQTEKPGSCTLYWNGDSSLPIAQSSFGSQVKQIQARGGNVIPSLGGWTADDATEDGQLTELADSCTDVNKIAQQIENMITTYDIQRIDFDIEADSINSSAGVDRRNKALKIVQDWAAANGRTFEVQYTLPTGTTGLAQSGKNLLANAKSNGVDVKVVNIMTFDYWEGDRPNLAQDTVTATTGLVNYLKTLYPTKTEAQLWNMVGVTEMIGVTDWGAGETFSLANADTVLAFAKQKGIAYLSFWALHRDNGGCAGSTTTQDNCSSIAQDTWAFSKKFATFTSQGDGGTDPTPTPTDPGTTPDPTPTPTPGECTSAAWSSSTVYTGNQTASYNGHEWTAKWWTQGETPGSTAVWQDKGACSGGSTTNPTPDPTPTPTPTPTDPTPGTCTAAAWNASTAYNGAAKVSYNGHSWTAKWWTQGETPGAAQWGPWTDNGAC